MSHQRPATSRPQLEPASSAMQYPGLSRLITDGTDSLSELIVSAYSGLNAMAAGVSDAISDGWPILMVLHATISGGYRCYPFLHLLKVSPYVVVFTNLYNNFWHNNYSLIWSRWFIKSVQEAYQV